MESTKRQMHFQIMSTGLKKSESNNCCQRNFLVIITHLRARRQKNLHKIRVLQNKTKLPNKTFKMKNQITFFCSSGTKRTEYNEWVLAKMCMYIYN